MADEKKDTEVLAQAKRRRFTAEYKRRIVREAEACRETGEIGALLRREGLYSSHLGKWRLAIEASEREALAARKRGPVAKVRDERDRRLAELERDNARLQGRLERAELIIEVQKKVSQLLGIPLPDTDENR